MTTLWGGVEAKRIRKEANQRLEPGSHVVLMRCCTGEEAGKEGDEESLSNGSKVIGNDNWCSGVR